MKVLLAGATGLVGGRTLTRLLDAGHDVVSVGRRASGVSGDRLAELTVDFAALPPLPSAEAAICCLGTTMATAGSREAFRAVDHDAVLAFSRGAFSAGASHLILVTAVGADPDAAAFYSRVKGEVEGAVEGVGFARVDFIRPGLIIGPRAERRPVESVMQMLAPLLSPILAGPLAKAGPIRAETIADAIVALLKSPAPGRYIHTNRELDRLVANTR